MIRLILTIVLSALAFVSMGANDCATSYHAGIDDNAMVLSMPITTQSQEVEFTYDAFGRRVSKRTGDALHRFGWDGNVVLHEWDTDWNRMPRLVKDETGREEYDSTEKPENPVTWVYDGTSFTPVAKVTADDRYTIVHDYLGTPMQAYDGNGELVWEMMLDVYGRVMDESHGDRALVPFRYQGQYEDVETGLYYKRFRYYSPEMGMYISSDPIGLAGNNPTLYGYVQDVNVWLDPWGLDCVPVKNRTKSSTNGLFYQSNTKHTPGQLGYRPNAGIEPRNSLDLFDKSIPSSTNPNHRYTYDGDTLHRFFSDRNSETWHWSGSTNQGANSIKGNQVPNDIKKVFNLPQKGW